MAEHEADDPEVVTSNPRLGVIFDEIYFVLCNFGSVRYSDRNVSDFLIVKNPIVLRDWFLGIQKLYR